MEKDILLLSKDVLKADYLSCYGGKNWDTPNIDSLVKSGTIFKNYYTVAPSSAMAYSCMFSGLNPFELNRSRYTEVEPFNQCPTLFDTLSSKGYENHVIWDESWLDLAWRFSKTYGQDTTYHNLYIAQSVGPHYKKGGKIKPEKEAIPIEKILETVENIFDKKSKSIFLWIHIPHVLKGRTGYGADIDIFDDLVGKLMNYFSRKCIYLTADHGHMDCVKGISGYGFHVYESAIKIPLITPDYFDKKEINEVISNIQLKNIIVDHKIYPQKYIYSDTQYYLQENRKLMVRKGDFKYIYNKRTKTEELYDLKYDSHEEVNLLIDSWYDINRYKNYYLEEVYYYPRWDEAKKIYEELKKERIRVWKEGPLYKQLLYKLDVIKKRGLANFYGFIVNKRKTKGRWDSIAQKRYYEK